MTCFSNLVFKHVGGKPCEELHDLDKDLCRIPIKNLILRISKDLALFLRILEDPNKGLCKDVNENWFLTSGRQPSYRQSDLSLASGNRTLSPKLALPLD